MIEDASAERTGPALPTPAYHEALRDHLKRTEPELWRWFAESNRLTTKPDDAAELALLKSAYRLDGGAHDVLVAYATLLGEQFGIDQEIVLYQELGAGERNAQVFTLNNRANVVFGGDLLDLLTANEQQAVLAHELAHIALWRRDGGDFLLLDHLVHRLADEPDADDVLVETARRLRLRTEVWADAAAAVAVDDLNAVVAATVKVSSGLRHVDPVAYLRQAQQILSLDATATGAWTHPELHIRVACLAAGAGGTSEQTLTALVSGPDDLDRLDVLGQLRVQELTARVLRSAADLAGPRPAAPDSTATGAVAEPNSNRSVLSEIRSGSSMPEPTMAQYLRNYPELGIASVSPVTDGEFAEVEPSVRWLAASLLVDVAMADEDLDSLDGIRALSREAERQGVSAEFDKILAKATDRTPAETKKLREATS